MPVLVVLASALALGDAPYRRESGTLPALLHRGLHRPATIIVTCSVPTCWQEAPAEAPAADEKKPLTEKDLKKVPKPDEQALKEKIAVEDDKIQKLQDRLQGIKDTLDSHENGRSEPNSELAIAKGKYNETRQEARRLQQEKRNIYDQIAAADELKKQQQDLTQRLRSELGFFSVEEIDRKIKVRRFH